MRRGSGSGSGAGQLRYVIQAEPSGLIKIGRSKLPEQRRYALQIGNQERLVLRGQARKASERALHYRFAAARQRGEWFRPEPWVAEWLWKCLGIKIVVPGEGVA